MTTASPTITLMARVAELKGIIEVLTSGHPDVHDRIAEVTVRRIDAEIAMSLMSEQELTAMLHKFRDQPVAAGSVSRPAAARELARRSRLSAHERMAEARERRQILGR